MAALLGGCAGGMVNNGGPVLWPPPPAEPRWVYETTLRSQASINPSSSVSRLKQAAGSGLAPANPLRKPYDVAARRGIIAVSDTSARIVHVFDVGRRRLSFFGAVGEGRLYNPLGVAIDDQGLVYVADAGRKAVVVFDAVGHFLRVLGESAAMVRPSDVAVTADGSRIYMVDNGGVESDKHQVLIFDAEGRELNRFGMRGDGKGQFNLPLQAALAPDGTLYVLDAGNFRVQAFDADGGFLRSWGRVGVQLGNLARPRGLAVDNEGRVYVTDAAYQNFQIFNDQGQLLLPVGERGDDRPGRYPLPAGISVDETNRVYVVDQFFRKVEVLRLLGDEERAGLAGRG